MSALVGDELQPKTGSGGVTQGEHQPPGLAALFDGAGLWGRRRAHRSARVTEASPRGACLQPIRNADLSPCPCHIRSGCGGDIYETRLSKFQLVLTFSPRFPGSSVCALLITVTHLIMLL